MKWENEMIDADAPHAEHPTERQVQAIWYDAVFRPALLHTLAGEEVRVLDPGEWNLAAGPDFKHAVLEVGASRTHVEGDVEIHLFPSDWVAHGHGGDTAYDEVVAHVTWYRGSGNEELDLPEGCLRICLGDSFRERKDFSFAAIDPDAYPFRREPLTRRCAALFAGNVDRVLAAIRAAGGERLRGRVEYFRRRLGPGIDAGQVFYEEVLAGLGYTGNARVFRRIAEELPWHDLPRNVTDATTALQTAAHLKVLPSDPWVTTGIRPNNHPERRLAQAAALFAPGRAVLDKLFACDLATKVGQRAAVDILCASHVLGRRRAAAILTNTLIPFACALGRLSDIPEWIVPEEINAPVRRTAFRLLGRDHNPALYATNGLLLQGLLHIGHTWCERPQTGCATCGFANQLERESGKD